MVTPFTASGKVDVEAVERICRRFAQCGVSPLVLGTTGEAASISAAENVRVVLAAVQGMGGAGLVYAGIAGNNVAQNMENAKAYVALGAGVMMSVLPYYYALTDSQMLRYYAQLADAVPQLMMYNIPATTHMSIPLQVVAQLSTHPNICGLKDSERDEHRMEECIAMFREREDFSYFLGYAALSAAALLQGADGIVPSTGNVVPAMFRQLYDAAISGNEVEARRLQCETNDIAKIYQANRTLGQSLAALKAMLSVLRLCEPNVLPPLDNLTADEINELRKQMAATAMNLPS
jgi:4-hydroxy-tetrahydrodipicolinate synthase